MKFQIETKKRNRFNKTVIVANISLSFNKKGMAIVELDSTQKDTLLNNDTVTITGQEESSEEIVKETIKFTKVEKVEEIEEDSPNELDPSMTSFDESQTKEVEKVEEIEEEEVDPIKPELADYLTKLDSMTKAALLQEAESLELDKSEYKDFNKGELLNYLTEIAKLNA